MANKKTTSIYSLQFALLCLSSFLFFASFNMIIPELPGYLEKLGGEEYKGFIIGLFTITAGLSRPFSGKLADKIGRIPVMVYGAVICFICGFLYPILTTVAGFLFLRFIHGMSTGFKPTGTAAFVADVVPYNRRGEAMGFLGFCSSVGMAMGPAIGSTIALYYNLNTMFYTSSGAALLSILILARMKETLPQPEPFRLRLLKLKKSEVFEPKVIAPCILLMLTTFSFGVVLTITPDLSEHIGIENIGLFFTTFTVSSLVTRFTAGKASDKIGRVVVLKAATLVLAIGMLMLGLAQSILTLIIAGCIFGIGVGMNNPTIFAWTIDLSVSEHRGRGISTMYIALEIGIGIGAFLSGWIYGNEPSGFLPTFATGSALCFLGFVFLQTGLYKKLIKSEEAPPPQPSPQKMVDEM